MNIKKSSIFLTVYITLYILVMRIVPEDLVKLVQNIFSIIGLIYAIHIMVNSLKNHRENLLYRFFLLLAPIFCILGDIMWVYTSEVKKIEVGILNVSSSFYILNNLALVIAVFFLIKKYTKRWDGIKMVVEISILAGILGYLAWGLFLGLIFPKLVITKFVDIEYLIQLFYVCSNFLILFGLSVFFIFNKNYLKYRVNKIEAFGFFIWFCTDLFYVYLEIHDMYSDNRIINLFWPLALLMLAISTTESKEELDIDIEENSLEMLNNLYIILFILVVIFYAFDNSVPIMALIPIFGMRFLLSKYMKVFEFNEELTVKYRENNEKLFKIANIDPLTTLFNRRKLVEELEQLVERNGEEIKSALLFIDLDRFKNINDWHGHEVGDKVLIETAKRLKRNTTEKDIVARQGGDEFIILLNDIKGENEVLERAIKIVQDFRIPFVFEKDKIIQTSISMGGAIYPTDSTDHYTLMKFADISLYKAKSQGKNKVVMYNNKMEVEQNRRLEIESRLYEALDKKELMLYYQPQIDTVTKNVIGMEALIRWKNKELGGFVSPMEFIGIAEENGFILSIGDFVIEQAAKDIKYINETYNLDIKVGINVSPKQFHTSEMTYDIEKAIEEHGLKPNWIDIEITESLAMNNEEKVMVKLHKLKNVGVKISIDDFGTGYSSLSYLKRFPVDTLKIDIEFIRGIAKNHQDYKIVKAITAMCKELEIKTIAEGVEEEEQFNILKELKCDQIQGYYFSKPLPIGDIEEKFFKR